MKTAEEYITEKYQYNNWGLYPPSRRLVTEWLEDFANAKAKALLEEAAEKATIWVETPINGTEFDFVERDLAEGCSSIKSEPFIEKISVFKESILSLIPKE